jgi:hypothetical protein
MKMVFSRLSNVDDKVKTLKSKIMIKVSLIITMFILAPAMHASQDVIEKVFQKYSGLEGATSVRISGSLLKMLAEVDKSDQDLNKIASSITSITILHAPEAISGAAGIDFYKEIVPALGKANYEEIMRVQQSGQQVLILADETDGSINELIMIVGGGGDNTLICIRGKLDINQLAALSGMDVPGINQLMHLQNR